MHISDSFAYIEHDGVVQHSDSNHVIIRISSEAGCLGCHASGSCNISGAKEKMVEVHGNYDLSPGDSVTVLMKRSMGYRALFLGYLFPLIIVLMFIIILSMHFSEVTAGLGSIGILCIYYFVLYLFRNRIRNRFTFTIKTI